MLSGGSNMRLEAGKLRHRLKLLAPIETQNASTGEVVLTWYELATVWGSFEPYSTKDMLAAASIQDATSVRAVLRYRDDVLSEMRVFFRGKYYEIVGAPLPDAESGLEYMTLMLKDIEVESASVLPTSYVAIRTGVSFVRLTLEVDSDEDSFTFPSAFVAGSLLVYINGILATPEDEYTEKVDQTGIDLTSLPADDDVVEVFYVKGGIAFARFTLETDGIEDSFTFPETFVAGSLLVYSNGVLATAGVEYDEKVDRTGLDFDSAPSADDVVEVFYEKDV